MNIDIDVKDFIEQYSKEYGKSYGYNPDDIKELIQILAETARNYSQQFDMLFDTIMTIPAEYLPNLFLAKGYIPAVEDDEEVPHA